MSKPKMIKVGDSTIHKIYDSLYDAYEVLKLLHMERSQLYGLILYLLGENRYVVTLDDFPTDKRLYMIPISDEEGNLISLDVFAGDIEENGNL